MPNFEFRDHDKNTDVVLSDINYEFLLDLNEDDPTREKDLWFVLPEENHAIRVTEQTCQVRLSRIVQDPTDHIGLLDDRDQRWFQWWRGTTPNFDEIMAFVGPYAEVHMTRYPRADYVAGFILHLTTDIEEITHGG